MSDTRPHPKGIHPTPWGYRAFVRVDGTLYAKSFKATEPIDKIKDWRELTRAKLVLKRESAAEATPIAAGTFREDAPRYLAAVASMTTYKERAKHIREWVETFGDQATDTITAAQIRTKREQWLTAGPRIRQRGKVRILDHKPLAASSVNHRLRALENFFTVLYPQIPNPVRSVPEATEPDAEARDVAPTVLDRIFAALPACTSKDRLLVFRWTAIPPKTFMRVKAEGIDLRAKKIHLPGRKKGKGTHGVTLPLLPKAVPPLRRLLRARALGEFSTSALYAFFQRGCEAAGVSGVTPYQLRHTFATEFLRITGDLRLTQKALNLSSPRLVERYARGAVEQTMHAAYRKVARAKRR